MLPDSKAASKAGSRADQQAVNPVGKAGPVLLAASQRLPVTVLLEPPPVLAVPEVQPRDPSPASPVAKVGRAATLRQAALPLRAVAAELATAAARRAQRVRPEQPEPAAAEVPRAGPQAVPLRVPVERAAVR